MKLYIFSTLILGLFLIPLTHSNSCNSNIKIESSSRLEEDNREFRKKTYYRDASKNLERVERYVNGEFDNYIRQEVFVEDQLVLRIVILKKELAMDTKPTGKYSIGFGFDDGSLNSISISEGREYVDLFRVGNNILFPADCTELEKWNLYSEALYEFFENISPASNKDIDAAETDNNINNTAIP